MVIYKEIYGEKSIINFTKIKLTANFQLKLKFYFTEPFVIVKEKDRNDQLPCEKKNPRTLETKNTHYVTIVAMSYECIVGS